MNEKDVFCFIPAKAASQRLKNKNILPLNGKPLMHYAIEAAIKSELFDDQVFLSTEDEYFATIGTDAGALIKGLRPKKLAFDPYGIKDVLHDFLINNTLNSNFQNVVVISPTCPLLSSNDIVNAYNLFKENKSNTLLSVSEMSYSAYRALTIENNKIVPLFEENIHKKSQELDKTYRVNGALIILNIDYFKKTKSFFSHPVSTFIMPRDRSVDIDTIDDFNFADFLLKSNRSL